MSLMSKITSSFLILYKKDCGCPGTGLPQETGQYLTANKKKPGSLYINYIAYKTNTLVIKAHLRVSNVSVALQLHIMKFTKSTFVNGDINTSPGPTVSNIERNTFTQEGERRRREKIRGKVKERKNKKDRYILHFLLADQSQLSIHKSSVNDHLQQIQKDFES